MKDKIQYEKDNRLGLKQKENLVCWAISGDGKGK